MCFHPSEISRTCYGWTSLRLSTNIGNQSFFMCLVAWYWSWLGNQSTKLSCLPTKCLSSFFYTYLLVHAWQALGKNPYWSCIPIEGHWPLIVNDSKSKCLEVIPVPNTAWASQRAAWVILFHALVYPRVMMELYSVVPNVLPFNSYMAFPSDTVAPEFKWITRKDSTNNKTALKKVKEGIFTERLLRIFSQLKKRSRQDQQVCVPFEWPHSRCWKPNTWGGRDPLKQTYRRHSSLGAFFWSEPSMDCRKFNSSSGKCDM